MTYGERFLFCIVLLQTSGEGATTVLLVALPWDPPSIFVFYGHTTVSDMIKIYRARPRSMWESTLNNDVEYDQCSILINTIQGICC